MNERWILQPSINWVAFSCQFRIREVAFFTGRSVVLVETFRFFFFFPRVPSGKCRHTATAYSMAACRSTRVVPNVDRSQSFPLFETCLYAVQRTLSTLHLRWRLIRTTDKMGSFKLVVPKCTCLVGVQWLATCREIKTVRCTEAGVARLK